MKIKGKTWKFGNDVEPGTPIITGAHLNTTSPKELAAHCMEDVNPGFASKVKPGDIMAAGKNFGCGSSREHAPIAVKAAGINCVIARSFARIFYRNAFHMGLPILSAPKAPSAPHPDGGPTGNRPRFPALSRIIPGRKLTGHSPSRLSCKSLLKAGGLIEYVREQMSGIE